MKYKLLKWLEYVLLFLVSALPLAFGYVVGLAVHTWLIWRAAFLEGFEATKK